MPLDARCNTPDLPHLAPWNSLDRSRYGGGRRSDGQRESMMVARPPHRTRGLSTPARHWIFLEVARAKVFHKTDMRIGPHKPDFLFSLPDIRLNHRYTQYRL
jgi:hypothetical protein